MSRFESISAQIVFNINDLFQSNPSYIWALFMRKAPEIKQDKCMVYRT